MYRTLENVSTPYNMTNESPNNQTCALNYRPISNVAPKFQDPARTDPLLYCLLDTMDSQFLHGSSGRLFGKYNENCTRFLSNRCAKQWDDICESVSRDKTTNFPNTADSIENVYGKNKCLPYGDQIIRDAALQRFKVATMNCNVRCEPHDPLNANSPLICYETRDSCSLRDQRNGVCFGSANRGECKRIYTILPEQIATLDQDPLMNKILERPHLAMDLLIGIYENMKQDKTLSSLIGTRLGQFYAEKFVVE